MAKSKMADTSYIKKKLPYDHRAVFSIGPYRSVPTKGLFSFVPSPEQPFISAL